MTYREYKPTWLQEKIFVDTYGREYNLSDVPMTMMTREDAFDKRGLTEEQIEENLAPVQSVVTRGSCDDRDGTYHHERKQRDEHDA